jgi:hypothetical protein
MTKTEFLELRAGEQRWVLLRCLRFVAGLIVGVVPPGIPKTVPDRHERKKLGVHAMDKLIEVAEKAALEKTEGEL